MNRTCLSPGCLILLLLGSLAAAADWPRFRGPDGNGISPETGLIRQFPQGGPPVLWTVPVGPGFAGPVIHDGKVYLLDRPDDLKDVLRCFALEDGRELWSFAYDAPGAIPENGSRGVPTVDGQFIYTLGPWGNLHCIDLKTHKPVWSAHLVNDFKDPEFDAGEPGDRPAKLRRAQPPYWGYSQAPVLYDDLVILPPQTQKVGLVAYEKATGIIRWKSPYVGRSWYTYVTPLLVTLCGVEQIIVMGQDSDPDKSPSAAPPARITSLDPRTGRVLWTTFTPKPYKIPVPQPLKIAEDRLFITGGLGFSTVVLEVQKDPQWTTRFVHRSNVAAAYLHTPILYKDHIYVTSHREHGSPNLGLICVNLQMDLMWSSGRKDQFDYGHSIIADGMILQMNADTGELSLIEASPADYRLLSRAKVLDAEGERVWAPMALSNGRLVLRDLNVMKCLDMRKH